MLRNFTLFTLLVMSFSIASAQESTNQCSTPNLDSATAVSLPHYNNNQVLEDYLSSNGYNSLPRIGFPSPEARTSSDFLEPKFLFPLALFIYRDGSGDPASSVTEEQAREFVCGVNELYRNAGTAIQFYIHSIEFESNNFFNQEITKDLHVYDLWSRKRMGFGDRNTGINVHFIRYNGGSEDAAGKATVPQVINLPYTDYSLYVRTHRIPGGSMRGDIEIVSTLAHELGHTLNLVHTHHPGRRISSILNEDNASISNGCYQESVARRRHNYWYDGCVSTDNMRKCEINGDFLCDTDADPRQSGRTSLLCNYIYPESGDYRTDDWGDLWLPPTHNMMSYAPADCRNELSRGQIGVMWMQSEKLKTFLRYETPTILSNSPYVCSGSTLAFTLGGKNLPVDAQVRWEVTPASGVVTVSSGVGRTANLQAVNASTQRQGRIIFTIIGPNNCYIARVQKEFWTGAPKVTGTLIGGKHQYLSYGTTPNEVCNLKNFATDLAIQGKATLSWQRTAANPTNTTWFQSGDNISSYFYKAGQTATYKLTVQNRCGTTSLTYMFKSVTCTSSGCGSSFSVYPNPLVGASSVSVINIPAPCPDAMTETVQSADTQERMIEEVAVFDSDGKMVLRKVFKGGKSKADVDLHGLRKGRYYLKVYNGEHVETHKVEVD